MGAHRLTKDELIQAKDGVLNDIAILGSLLLKDHCDAVITSQYVEDAFFITRETRLIIYHALALRLWDVIDDLENELSEYE
jgi:hypothetical protein